MTNKPDMSAEVIAVPAELFRQLKHYTICHLMNFPSCGAPTEAEIDAALLSNASGGQPVAVQEALTMLYRYAEAAGFDPEGSVMRVARNSQWLAARDAQGKD